MPKVKLIVTRWLRESMNLGLTDPGEIAVCVPDGESILGMIRCLAAERGDFWRRMIDENGQNIHMDVLVILNGRIVNPYDRKEATLREGDEVMFMPMMAGG